jgi:Ctr copper transporter family
MSASSLPCGTSAQCVDTVTNEVVDGHITCPDGTANCELQCVIENADNNTSSNEFCYGIGVSMYMDGFKSMAFSRRGSVECLNLLFVSWTLNSELKFALGCVGVFLISVFVQMMTHIRQKLKKGGTKLKAVISSMATVLLYGIQVALSYFIMLAAMTYSVEIFCMVCAGLTVGFAMFNIDLPASSTEQCCDIDIDIDAEEVVKSNYDVLPNESEHTFKST